MAFQVDIKKLVKRHSALLLPIAITVAAVLVFVPTYMIGNKIKSEMEQSVSLASQVDSFSRDAVSDKQYEKQSQLAALHERDANAVERTVLGTSMRELLAYNVFPTPLNMNETEATVRNFGKSYRSGIEDLVTGMNGRDVPTEDEMREMLKMAGLSNTTGVTGDSAIIDQICKDRAAKISVYANPDNFPLYTFWNEYPYGGPQTALNDCWKSQLAYWICKDVTDTIKKMNEGSTSVNSSAVKRLVGISFSYEPKADSTQQSGSSTTADMPAYVGEVAPGQQPSPTPGSVFSSAWTGRVTNEQMDVVHFAVTVVVNAKSVMQFVDNLCSDKEHLFKGWDGKSDSKQLIHNQITVLKSTQETISTAGQPGAMSTGSNRYRYGNDAVVQFSVVCEYVFNKVGYAAVKPTQLQSDSAAAGSAPSARPYTPPRSSGKKRRVAEDE